MKTKILHAEMTCGESDDCLGRVCFEVEGHRQPYELTLQCGSGLSDWNYSLHFLNESGSEEEIDAVLRAIEEDDDFFDRLAEAAAENRKARES